LGLAVDGTCVVYALSLSLCPSQSLSEVCRTFRQMVICGCLVSNIALAMLEIFRCALREQTHKNAPPALNRGSSPEEISFRQSMEPVDAATSNCI